MRSRTNWNDFDNKDRLLLAGKKYYQIRLQITSQIIHTTSRCRKTKNVSEQSVVQGYNQFTSSNKNFKKLLFENIKHQHTIFVNQHSIIDIIYGGGSSDNCDCRIYPCTKAFTFIENVGCVGLPSKYSVGILQVFQ